LPLVGWDPNRKLVPMIRETSDLQFAAYIMALEHTMLGAYRDGRRVIFQFSIDDEEWQELQVGWSSRTGLVIAFEFAMAEKALKSLVHSPHLRSGSHHETDVL